MDLPDFSRALYKVAQLTRTARMTKATQRFAFDLPNALTGEAELLTNFFERVLATILQTEAQSQNAGFARCQGT